jgi:hypothetical protein
MNIWSVGVSMNIRKSIPLVLVLFLIAMGFTAPAVASDSTTVQECQHQWYGDIVGKMGTTTEYYLSSGDDLHPQYYAYVIGKGAENFFVGEIYVHLSGKNPLNNPLDPMCFTSLAAKTTPDSSGQVNEYLEIIADLIANNMPYGLGAIMEITGSTTAQTGYDTSYAYGKWVNDGPLTWEQERNLKVAFQLAVDPDYEGTYTIEVQYMVDIWKYAGSGSGYSVDKAYLTDTLYYYFDNDGGGGGCPILSVYDGNSYVSEGLLDIHNDSDVEQTAVLHTVPARVGSRYLLKLTEHNQTTSHIDAVKLYARLDNGNVKSLPLVSAQHSEQGNVMSEIKHSDDIRVNELGADHNKGTSQYIDLQFVAPKGFNVVEYIFWIEGYNEDSKW